MPSIGVLLQPALGVAVIEPWAGDCGSRSSGPKQAIPTDAISSQLRRNSTVAPSVSSGVVVGTVVSATMSRPWATATRNLVPPASIAA